MFLTGEPQYPAERTLLVSGAIDLVMQSKAEGGRVVQTPVAQEYEWEDNAASRAELRSTNADRPQVLHSLRVEEDGGMGWQSSRSFAVSSF